MLLPPPDCLLCPRLASFRHDNSIHYPSFYNAPVPSFGESGAALLVVGLAPGLKGANQTGRPFTGDYAGIILYAALQKYGFAAGEYDPACVTGGNSDSFRLINCRVTNAVRCVPPGNRPEPSEIKHCNPFLVNEIQAMPHLKIILTLGQVSHKAVIQALGFKQSTFVFGHAKTHHLQLATRNLQLINSYHTSRYNINTGVLTQGMFDAVVAGAREALGK